MEVNIKKSPTKYPPQYLPLCSETNIKDTRSGIKEEFGSTFENFNRFLTKIYSQQFNIDKEKKRFLQGLEIIRQKILTRLQQNLMRIVRR